MGKLKEISIFLKATKVAGNQNIFSKEDFVFSGYHLFCNIRTLEEDFKFFLAVFHSFVFDASKLPHFSDIQDLKHFYS